MGILAYVSTRALMYVSPLAGQFFGCWLLEFSFGMIIATKFDRFDKILDISMIVPLALAYIVGFSFGSFPEVWPLARPLYGIALTLFIWTVYNIIRNLWGLKWIARAFVFIGVNSYALYLINQPFIQDYFIFITSLFRDIINPYGYPLPYFNHPIFGSRFNSTIYSPDKYILILLSYVVLMIFLAYVLTKLDNGIQKKLVGWSTKQLPTKEQVNHSFKT
jgi:membrane-bound acyltransferase YfiQ involved in biofilm formation